MNVKFEKVLCCDYVSGEFNNTPYYQMLIYLKGNLYKISIDKAMIEKAKSAIGKRVNISTEMTTYNGKNKFKLISDIQFV